MKRTLLAVAAIGLLLPVGANAADCKDAEDQLTLNQCAAQDYQAADTELNSLYHKMRQRIGDDADTRRLLSGAESAWVSFRDAECTFAASGVGGGSMYPTVYDQCLTELTLARVAQFKDYLSAEEGDMGPIPPAE